MFGALESWGTWAAGWATGAPTEATGTATEVTSEAEAHWYLDVNEQQKQAVVGLRTNLQSKGVSLVGGIDDEYSLLRFLKAREFDVQKAAAMYEDMVSWRKENEVDSILERESFPEQDQLLETYPMFYHKTDRYGRPIYIELLGQADSEKLLEIMSVERLVRYHIWCWEKYHRIYLPACSKSKGMPIITTCVIVDLAGLSLKNFNTSTQRIMNAYSKIDQDYYPEHLGQLFIINAPLIFRGIWAAVQPLLQERTRRKVVILGSDYLPTLRQVIDDDNLPTIFGGKSELPADMKHSVGPWVGHEASYLAASTMHTRSPSVPAVPGGATEDDAVAQA